MKKEWLDKRICDIEYVENTQTYREFIVESADEFGITYKPLDTMEEKELGEFLDFLDYLWEK